MRSLIKFIFFFFIIINSVLAVDTSGPKDKVAYELYKELRCLVCQNQSLLESNAPLALDLKKVVMDKIELGQTESEIKTFLVDRYGEFILLKPKYSIHKFQISKTFSENPKKNQRDPGKWCEGLQKILKSAKLATSFIIN